MTQYFSVHPETPQRRLVTHAVDIVRDGGVIVYPTDSCYAFGCHIGNKTALERIRQLRDVDATHNFTLVCRDLSEIAEYARVDNPAYRLLKAHTPGPYTFILKASREVPRRLQNPRRKTVGLRVPGNRIARSLLESLGEPLMSSTLILPGDDIPLSEPEEMLERLQGQVDLVIDGGNCGREPTTVVDLTEGKPTVCRRGVGDVAAFDT
jgi:tRNA threonylcarbamoyl adenosine modification protein (Sua5/YciO/YrdC/YwlC family)